MSIRDIVQPLGRTGDGQTAARRRGRTPLTPVQAMEQAAKRHGEDSAEYAVAARAAGVHPPRPVPDPVEYVALRPMTLDGERLHKGDVVPGAAAWPRIESWIRARYIEARPLETAV